MRNVSIEAKLDMNVEAELGDITDSEVFFEELIEKFHEQYDGIEIEVTKLDINEW